MSYGILSILPPIIAIVLALLTKEVITSLFLGIIVGGVIFTGGNILVALEEIIKLMSKKLGDNSLMLIFLALLGSLVMVMNMAGGSFAYGKWAKKHIKNKTTAKLAGTILGMLIFIDDYFNCLTVGAVMKPIMDENKVSRAKLAQIIDSSAAPVCILAPISSWAASVVAIIGDSGIDNPMKVFVNTIPLNLYALLTIFSLFYFCFSKHEICSMEKYEINDTSLELKNENVGYTYSENGKVIDLVLPILTLIVVTLLMMLRTGGYFSKNVAMSYAFGNSNVNMSLVVAAIFSLIVAFVLYIPRKLIKFKDFMDGLIEGMKTMITPIVILILAWTIGGITSEKYLNTGSFIASVLTTYTIPMWIFPSIIFIVSSFLSFSTGTAWGTFGILIPIIVPILVHTNTLSYLNIVLASIFSGSVFGDHCSPISDTTILSSAGANCNHLIHVSTQLPYAIICGISTIVGFLVAGIIGIDLIAFPIGVIVLLILIFILKKKAILKYD
ncbi:hypothetical protein HMPREF3188_01436 [Tissierellia bacterium KA00581]|nr:hypothetical protein HMPREF3188_01436 [Tissierellia bacterium KA00581]